MTTFTGPGHASAPVGELTTRQAEALLRLTESAPAVGSRPQFFVWSQRNLHTLLPHRALVCGSWQRHRRAMEFAVFHNVVVSAPALGWLGQADSALMRALTDSWVKSPWALALRSEQLDGEARAQSESLLNELGCDTWLVHGVTRPQRPHEVESLFVAAAEPGLPAHAGVGRLLDMALPCLHTTWRRVHTTDLGAPASRAIESADSPPATNAPLRVLLTDREREILRLAQGGCTNAVIGARLAISPLTVKNHIQKILRKFKARNRAQAVALAMSNGLLTEEH